MRTKFLLVLCITSASWMMTGCASTTPSTPSLPVAPASLQSCQPAPPLQSPEMGAMVRNHLETVRNLNECRQKLKTFNDFYAEQRALWSSTAPK